MVKPRAPTPVATRSAWLCSGTVTPQPSLFARCRLAGAAAGRRPASTTPASLVCPAGIPPAVSAFNPRTRTSACMGWSVWNGANTGWTLAPVTKLQALVYDILPSRWKVPESYAGSVTCCLTPAACEDKVFVASFLSAFYQ